MMSDLQSAPPDSVLLMQTPPHNPTGLDPTVEQWEEIAKVAEERRLIPFFDCAFHVSREWRQDVTTKANTEFVGIVRGIVIYRIIF